MPTYGWRWAPKWASDQDCDMKPRKTEFGDGYTQRTAATDLRPLRAWDFTFEDRPSEVRQMTDFLEARNGAEAFEIEHPDSGVPVTVVCERYTKRPISNTRHQVRARFEEVRVG